MRKLARTVRARVAGRIAHPELAVCWQGVEAFPELPPEHVMSGWMKAAIERSTEITVRFVGTEEGRALNHQFRGKDYATNVITFDYAREPVVMADIAICVPVLHEQAQAQNKTFEAHLAHLLIHGVLHAHGYDHLDEQEAEVMESRETALLTALGFPNPYSDRIGMVHD